MKHFGLALAVAGGLVAGLVFGVQAQDRGTPAGILIGQIQPLLIDVTQQVPVSLTLSVPVGAAMHTVTVPLLLDLGITLGIADTVTATVNVGPGGSTAVTVSEPTPTPAARPSSNVAIVTDTTGKVYEVTNLRVKYLGTNSKHLMFTFTLVTGNVARQVQDRISLDTLRRLTVNQQAINLYLVDGSEISISPEAYSEKATDGRVVESGSVMSLTLATGSPPQPLIGFEGSIRTSLGLRSTFEIPLEAVRSIEFDRGQPVETEGAGED